MPDNATVFWCILLLARLLRDPKHKVPNNTTDLKHVLIQVSLLVNATGRAHAFIQVPLSLDPEHKVSEKVADLQHLFVLRQFNTKCQTMRQTCSMCLCSTTQSVRQCDRPAACACAAQHKVSDNATDLQHVLVQHNTKCQTMRQTCSMCLCSTTQSVRQCDRPAACACAAQHKVSDNATDLQHVLVQHNTKCQTMRQTCSMCLCSTTQSVRQCDRPAACACAAQHKVSDNATDLQHVLVQHNTKCQTMRQTSSICLYINTDVPSVGSNKVPP